MHTSVMETAHMCILTVWMVLWLPNSLLRFGSRIIQMGKVVER